ncbi:MAG: CBS domain-containing protein [Archaeoglobaceae archaeon]
MPAKTVREVMITDVISLQPEDRIQKAIETFRDNKISGAPVVDDESKVIGVLSEADIINLTSIVSLPDIELNPFNPFVFLTIRKYWKRVREMPDEIKQRYDTLLNGSVKDVMSTEPVTVTADTSVSEASRIMSEKDFNRLPVVDKEGKLAGVVARQDILGIIVK